MKDLTGRVAVVTGSTSGIGKEIAEALAGAGAHLVLNGRTRTAEVEEQLKTIRRKYKVRALFCRADMTKPEDVDNLIRSTVGIFGRVDILVNNAGMQRVHNLEDFPLEDWNEIIAAHLTAPFVAIKAAIPYMKRQQWGRIINIGSAQGKLPGQSKAAYVAAKHGLLGLMKATVVELASHGINCNTIAPGFTLTPLVTKQIARHAELRGMTEVDVMQEIIMGAHLSGLYTEVRAIADAALFLCSSAGNNIHGLEMLMDGGWTAGLRPPSRPASKADVVPTATVSAAIFD